MELKNIMLSDETFQRIGLVISVLAFFRIICFSWYFIRTYILTRLGFRKNLMEYGKWAVITGATDGIGKEYARQLAEEGLNIVLISRTKEKLEAVASEIRNKSKVETLTIVYDFTDIEGFDALNEILNGLDIGLLINNVGMAYGGPLKMLHQCDINKISDIMKVNTFSVLHMTHFIQKGMMKRKRGAIVHISSGSIFLKAPGLNVYPATKQFVLKLVESLQLECEGTVDHQVLTTMYVESNMSKVKATFTIPSARDYVSSAIKTIGVAPVTCGYPSQEIVYLLLNAVPKDFSAFCYKTMRKLKRTNKNE